MSIVTDAFEVGDAMGFSSGVVLGVSNTGPWSDYTDAPLGSVAIYNNRLYQLVGTPANTSLSWKDITSQRFGPEVLFGRGFYDILLGSGSTYSLYPNNAYIISLDPLANNITLLLPSISSGVADLGDAILVMFNIAPGLDMSTQPVRIRAATGDVIQTTTDTELILDVRVLTLGFVVRSSSNSYRWEVF